MRANSGYFWMVRLWASFLCFFLPFKIYFSAPLYLFYFPIILQQH